jgi:hypothetical protein
VAKFDPKKYQTDKPKASFEDRPKKISEGKKILAGVGAAFKKRNGKKILEIGYVVIKDLESRGEEGLIYVDQLYLTESALFRLSNLVIAIGWDEPFDYESLDDITQVMLTGPFEGVFKSKSYNGKDYINLQFYNSVNWDRDKDDEPIYSDKEDSIIERAEEGWKKILQYRMDEPDKYGTYLSGNASQDKKSGDDYEEDEIPF